MSELIGFEYNAKGKKISKVDSLWAGELFVYPFKDEYRLCVKLGSNFMTETNFATETKTGRFFINAYDILEEKFYNLYEHDEVFKFCGKIRIKGENVYGRHDLLAQSDDSTTPKVADSATPKIIHIKLPNEIERDAGIDPAYKANKKYNVLTFCCGACYFNTEYIGEETWKFITSKSETPAKNNCEVEIEINGGFVNGVLGAEWVDVPF